jgi:hypothetical protein
MWIENREDRHIKFSCRKHLDDELEETVTKIP